ncbi:hypothetical protein CDAR_308931 [Caerostris darwini]|uniref:MD-2-related lipid-recognition domain-containing protein n=1 Tax=Caerostris darwini TaxID=1538125 RepID=A0AAV4U5J5_9ARAC|nr:hypothetical protein CDAR_308931 [Caerostris darwini]
MKGFYFLLGFLFLNVNVWAIHLKTCGSGKQIISINEFKMTPDPISLTAKQIEVTVEGEIQEDIPPAARIQLKIWKVIPFFGWKLPAPFCVLPMGCDVEHCSFLDKFSQPEANSTQSVCPVEAHTFNSTRTVDMPSLGGLTKWLVSGRFQVELKITKNSQQLSCHSVEGEARRLVH